MSNRGLLDRSVASAFYGRFASLRPIQEATIKPILEKKNVVISSGTGSGKTEAVIVPLLSLYWTAALQADTLSILYIAPTKALVNDLEKRLLSPLTKLGLRLGIRHGDRDDLTNKQIPHLLITTPESLDVLLFKKERILQTIQAIVIDEVHLLYNTQRGLHLSILLQRINLSLGRPVQWAALSATISVLANVRDFLFPNNEESVFLQYPSQRSIDAHIKQIYNDDDLLDFVKVLLAGSSATKLLFFANSRRACEKIVGILNRDQSVEQMVFAHYSSLSAELRIETEEKFSSSRTAICVATSTLELGIDIGDIDAVLLWGAPSSSESFLQRIGRGNRRQNKANVICLIPDDSKGVIAETLKFLALLDTAQEGELPVLKPYELFGAAGQQCLNVIASDHGRYTRIADLCEMFKFKEHLTRVNIESILAELAAQGYVQHHGYKNQYGADQRLYDLVDLRMIYGNFGANSQVTNVIYESKLLGSVPAINLLRIKPGMHVRFAGKTWNVRKTSTEGFFITPAFAQNKSGFVDFIYPGAGMGFDAFLCDRMWKILSSQTFPDKTLDNALFKIYSAFVNQIEEYCHKDTIPYFRQDSCYTYVTFGGRLVNKALALITNQWEYSVNEISLSVPTPVQWGAIPTDPLHYEPVFSSLFEVTSEQSIYQTMLPSELQLYEFIQNWLKDQTVEVVLNRLKSSGIIEVKDNLFKLFVSGFK